MLPQRMLLSLFACLSAGCCQTYCQCFMGYGFYRDCGLPRVWLEAEQRCGGQWEEEQCGVTTPASTSTTK